MISRRIHLTASFVFVTVMLLALFARSSEGVVVEAQSEERTLVAAVVEEAPILDGVADEAFWAEAPEILVNVRRGFNDFSTTVSLKSVYMEDMVYFLMTYEDPTESYIRSPWEMQEDGTWIQLRDPDDKGGDNNVWYEDKMSIIWPINNSIVGFEEDGCFAACHRASTGDPKPYGNKYTESEGETGDMWHWKSVRNLNQIHDQFLDHTPYSAETPGAGRKSDPSESGGYRNNINEDKTGPAFMPAGDDFPRDGYPGYLLEDEMVPFDASLFQPGDRVPGIIKSEFVGDGGDILAGWKWVDGVWTIEFGRALVTGSDRDVQFDDLSATYYFGVAIFENAQVRHAYHSGSLAFVFGQ